MKRIASIVVAVWLLAQTLDAKLSIVATTTDLQALVLAIASGQANVKVLCPAGGDPHYLEARPSQIIQVRGAGLLVSNGAELESGWLPLLLRGARRLDLEGGPASFQASDHVELLEIPGPGASRADGDVHALGNPHFMLDPVRAAQVGQALAEKLAGLDPGHAEAFRASAKAFDERMHAKVKDWQRRVEATGVKKVIAYHKDLNYLFERLGLQVAAYIEPKPGLSPTAWHLTELVRTAKAQNISLIVLSHLYPVAPAEKLAASVPGLRWERVAGQVGGLQGVDDLSILYEKMVQAVEGGR